MKNVGLYIETYQSDLVIPFKGLKEIDEFTSRFNNINDLSIFLIEVLQINLLPEDIISLSVSYDYIHKKTNTVLMNKIQVKYAKDNYDLDSLKLVFKEYLCEKPERIFKSNIRFMNFDPIIGYTKHNENINLSDIRLAVNSYIKNDNSKAREAYFLLKKDGYANKVKINRIRRTNSNTRSLNDFDPQETYFQSLINYSQKGEEEYARAMELIASSDLEILQRNMNNKYYGIVDGISNPYINTDDILALEDLTGMSIEKLMEYSNNINAGKKRR